MKELGEVGVYVGFSVVGVLYVATAIAWHSAIKSNILQVHTKEQRSKLFLFAWIILLITLLVTVFIGFMSWLSTKDQLLVVV